MNQKWTRAICTVLTSALVFTGPAVEGTTFSGYINSGLEKVYAKTQKQKDAEKISRTYSDECRPLCHELKLPQTAFDILMFLANNPEYKTARDIVEIRKIKANLVSVNVDKLVNEGYLERKPVENDRRKTELVCTKKAGTVIERGRRIQQQFTANLFAGIDEEQKKQLTIVMEQLENNMDEIIRRKSHK